MLCAWPANASRAYQMSTNKCLIAFMSPHDQCSRCKLQSFCHNNYNNQDWFLSVIFCFFLRLLDECQMLLFNASNYDLNVVVFVVVVHISASIGHSYCRILIDV